MKQPCPSSTSKSTPLHPHYCLNCPYLSIYSRHSSWYPETQSKSPITSLLPLGHSKHRKSKRGRKRILGTLWVRSKWGTNRTCGAASRGAWWGPSSGRGGRRSVAQSQRCRTGATKYSLERPQSKASATLKSMSLSPVDLWRIWAWRSSRGRNPKKRDDLVFAEGNSFTKKHHFYS